jgi:hypothetical protein
MRCETWQARLVFALGALVMIATSPPPTWHATKERAAELQSEGQGDDKILRVHVRMTDGVARDAGPVRVEVSGSVDRPASDLTIAWLDPDAPLGTIAIPEPFGSSDDFLTVYSGTERWEDCPDEDVCERVLEGRIATASSVGYAMTLEIQIVISGSKEKRPPGEIEARVEVLDAP